MYSACISNVSWLPLRIQVSLMYPACILHLGYVPLKIHDEIHVLHHVSRMYPECILITLPDTFIPHVSLIYLQCILHVLSWMYPRTSSDTCNPHVSCMYSACVLHVSCMYPVCILHVSLTYPACVPPRTDVPTLQGRHDASKIHVSCFCISVYLDVSWWRVQDTCILMYLDMYPVWHQGSA